MANQVVNRSVNIFIESGQAQKALDILIKKENALKDALAAATNPKQIEKLKADLEKLSEPLDRARKKLSGELSPAVKDLQKTVNDLGNRLKHMSEQDADFSTVVAQYRQANKELDVQRGKLGLLQRAMRTFFQEVKVVAVGVLVGNTLQSAFQTVLGYITGIFTGAAKISDELANIQRVTGLTAAEVKTLNSELKKFDTRTSVSSLREIVVVAGQLGVAKEEVLGFTKEIDKLSVALGGQLGDVNNITSELGKILNVFEGTITAENISHLGNAIIDLANKGVATAPFIVDFTQRLSGIAKTANVSLSAILGLAAGLEESGQKVESSSTAIQKLFTSIAQDVPKAAEIAGVEINKFTELFAKAPEEALLLFAKGLQKDKASFAEIATTFKDAGEEGARVISTLSVLGTKTDFFREKIQLAGIDITETTEKEKAFALMNNTAGAALDKFKKNLAGLFTSQTFQQAGEAAIRLMNSFLNVIKSIPEFVRENRFALLTLAAGVLVLNGAYIKAGANAILFRIIQITNAAASLVVAAALNVARAALVAYTIATSGAVTGMTLLQRAGLLLKTAFAAGLGPIGAVLTVVGALVIGIGKLFSRTRELNAEQRASAEISKRASDIYTDQVTRLEVLKNKITDTKTSLEEKKAAYEELIKLNPAFAETLRLDAQGHLQGVNAIDAYIKSLKGKAEVEAKYSLLIDKLKQKQEAFNKLRAEGGNDLANLTDEQLEKRLREQANQSTNVFSSIGKVLGKKIADGVVAELDVIDKLKKDIENTPLSNTGTNDIAKSLTDTSAAGVGLAGAFDIATASLEELRKHLKELKKELTPLNKDTILPQIKATQQKINELLGKKLPGENKLKQLLEDLQKLKDSVGLAGLPEFEKELGELDIKYAKLRERAGNNAKLLLIIDELHAEERVQLIQKFAAKEVDIWQKAQVDVNKKKDELLEKNIKAAKALVVITADEVEKQFELLNKDRLAKRELAVLKEHGKKKLAAELDLLKEQEQQELQQKDLTENQKLLIEENFRKRRRQAEIDHLIGTIELVAFFAQEALNIEQIFANAKTQKENDELERDRRVNDKKKGNLDRQLRNKLISQLTYDREVQKLDKQQEAREKEARLKQFKRDKAAQLAQAAINGAGAVVTTLNKFGPPIPPNFLAIAAMAFTLAATVANVVTIASRKPPEFGSGGLTKGPAHSDRSKGMPVVDPYTGRVHAYLEGGEGIGSKRTMNDRRRYNVSGTPSQIFSLLNGVNGGVQWTSGATLRPAWSTTRPKQINFSAVNSSIGAVRKFYASGGVFDNNQQPVSSSQQTIPADMLLLMRDMISTNAELRSTLSDIQRKGIKSNVVMTEFEDQQSRRNAIINDATLKP